MHKLIYLGTLGVALALLLAACGVAPGDPPQVPAEAEIAQPEAEELSATDDVGTIKEARVPTEEPVVETVEPADEMMATEEAVVEKVEVEEEMIPAEEEMMAEKDATTEPTAEAMVQAEQSFLTEEPQEMTEAPSGGPTAEQQALLASLTVKGAPPELFNEVWLNSEALKLEDLRGQVVIVEFWTFG